MLRFSCPSCKMALQAADQHTGTIVVCPGCKSQMKVPKAAPTVSNQNASTEPAKPANSSTSGTPEEKLRELLARYGHQLCQDARRFEALLRDHCVGYKREVFILVSALREGVAADLLARAPSLPLQIQIAQLCNRLHDHLALTEAASEWAVKTWAIALGVGLGTDEPGRSEEKRHVEDDDLAEEEAQLSVCCPSCESTFDVARAGAVECPDCEWAFTVDDDGEATDGFPIETCCPECGHDFHAQESGDVQCPDCGESFEIDNDGDVVDSESDEDEDEDENDDLDEDVDDEDFDDEDENDEDEDDDDEDWDEEPEVEGEDDELTISVCCPSCRHNYDVDTAGETECPECEWDFEVDEDGEVTDGEPIEVSCPHCGSDFPARESGGVECPQCDASFEIDEDGEPVDDRISVSCPSCNHGYDVDTSGETQCPECGWEFEVDDDGDVTDGLPIEVCCPECGTNFHARESGEVECSSCEATFDIDEEGNPVDEDEDEPLPMPGNPRCTAQIKSIRQEHDVSRGGEKGIILHIAFDVTGMKGGTGHVAAYFYFSDGDALKDFDQQYRSGNGHVSTGENIVPPYDSATWTDFQLFIPYSQLHLSDGRHDLYFQIEIFSHEDGAWKTLARSGNQPFSASWNQPIPAQHAPQQSLPDWDGSGPCSKCRTIINMKFDSAVCPICRHRMSWQEAFQICGSYHGTLPRNVYSERDLK